MALGGRNAPCGCRSGKKAKRCCGVRRGPGPAELAKASLFDQRRRAVRVLWEITRDEFDLLFAQMIDLPVTDVSMQLRLPRILGPELEALRRAIADDDEDAVDDLVDPAVAQLDDPQRRAELMDAVLALVEANDLDPKVAAVAVVDLTTASSALLRSSVVEALAVSAGATRTPAGLLVVSR